MFGRFFNTHFQSSSVIAGVGGVLQHPHLKLKSLTCLSSYYTTNKTSQSNFCLLHKFLQWEGCNSSYRWPNNMKKLGIIQKDPQKRLWSCCMCLYICWELCMVLPLGSPQYAHYVQILDWCYVMINFREKALERCIGSWDASQGASWGPDFDDLIDVCMRFKTPGKFFRLPKPHFSFLARSWRGIYCAVTEWVEMLFGKAQNFRKYDVTSV